MTVDSSKPTISLCMIVKDEAQHLERCLLSVQPYVDEIIVVDTGSQDNTQLIAQSFTSHVYSFSWGDDFAAARNTSLEKASGDWILVLDADEKLVVVDHEFRQHLVQHSEKLAFLLQRRNTDSPDQELGSFFSRLFRNHSALRYEGVYHEQLQYKGLLLNDNQVDLLPGLSILHYGYEPELLRTKQIDRNIPMLERQREQGNLDSTLLNYLAHLYDTTQQSEKAENCYQEILDRLFPSLLSGDAPQNSANLGPILYALISRMIAQREYESARLLCQRGLEWRPGYPPMHFAVGALLMDLELYLGATPYFLYCLQLGQEKNYYSTEPFLESFVGVYPAFHLGLAYQHQQKWQAAKAFFESALSFDSTYVPAQEHLATVQNQLNSTIRTESAI